MKMSWVLSLIGALVVIYLVVVKYPTQASQFIQGATASAVDTISSISKGI